MSFRGAKRTRNLEIPGSMLCIAPERRSKVKSENKTMTGAETLDVARDAIWTIVVVSSPLMVIPDPGAAADLRAEDPCHVCDSAAGAAVHGGFDARPHDADLVANHWRLMHCP